MRTRTKSAAATILQITWNDAKSLARLLLPSLLHCHREHNGEGNTQPVISLSLTRNL